MKILIVWEVAEEFLSSSPWRSPYRETLLKQYSDQPPITFQFLQFYSEENLFICNINHALILFIGEVEATLDIFQL